MKTLILSANCSTGLSCPPGKKTHDSQGRCCVFPFTYGGVSYDSCTTVANGNKPWCSFDSVYAGKWANCGKENIVFKEDSYANIPLFLMVKNPYGIDLSLSTLTDELIVVSKLY